MNEMETSHGKLLFMIHKLSSSNLITKKNKDYLKDLIIDQDQKLFAIMKDYNQNGTELTLKNDILAILWNDRHEQNSRQSPNTSSSSVERRKPKGLQIKIPAKNIQKIPGRNL